jgi:hypothetical protein
VAGESKYIKEALKQSPLPWFIKGINAQFVLEPVAPVAISVLSLYNLKPQSAAESALMPPMFTQNNTLLEAEVGVIDVCN